MRSFEEGRATGVRVVDSRGRYQTFGGRQIGATLAVAAVVLVAIGLRPSIVSMGPILRSVIEHFGLSHAVASLLTSIPDLLMGLCALPTPWLARRYGRNPVLIFALVLLCAATFLRALVGDVFSLLFATAGVGVGIAIAGALIAGFIKARFAHKAALMMGIYATALSVGSTVAAAVTGPVAEAAPGGWRTAAGMWSLVVLVGIVAWLFVTVKEHQLQTVAPAASAPSGLPWGDLTAWLVAGFFACVNLLFYSILAWTAPMYQEAGQTSTTAGAILATFTAVFTVANPIFGWASKSEDRRLLLASASAITVAGLVGVALEPTAAPFLWISLAAFGLGGAFTLGMTLPLDNTKTAEEANSWNAFVLMVGYVIAAAGPLAVGQLRDLTGNFSSAYWLLVGVAAAMLLLSPVLKPRSA